MARKIIRFDTADEKMMRNVKTEYRTHRHLSHPNIAKYVDAEWLDGEVRFYMEYFENGSLDTLKIGRVDDLCVSPVEISPTSFTVLFFRSP